MRGNAEGRRCAFFASRHQCWRRERPPTGGGGARRIAPARLTPHARLLAAPGGGGSRARQSPEPASIYRSCAAGAVPARYLVTESSALQYRGTLLATVAFRHPMSTSAPLSAADDPLEPTFEHDPQALFSSSSSSSGTRYGPHATFTIRSRRLRRSPSPRTQSMVPPGAGEQVEICWRPGPARVSRVPLMLNRCCSWVRSPDGYRYANANAHWRLTFQSASVVAGC